MDAEQKPSPAGWMISSRKGLLTLLVIFMGGVFALLVAVQVFRGRLSVEAGFSVCTVTLLGSYAVIFKLIDAIAREDVATKTGPTTIAAGGDVKVEKEGGGS